jgi:hypothetical protein
MYMHVNICKNIYRATHLDVAHALDQDVVYIYTCIYIYVKIYICICIYICTYYCAPHLDVPHALDQDVIVGLGRRQDTNLMLDEKDR